MQMTSRGQGEEHKLNKKAQVTKERADWNTDTQLKRIYLDEIIK